MNITIDAQAFYKKYAQKNVIALDENGDEVRGQLESCSWRGTLGIRLPNGKGVQAEYDPETTRVAK